MVELEGQDGRLFAEFADRAALHHYRLQTPAWTEIPGVTLGEHLRSKSFLRPARACLTLSLDVTPGLLEDPMVFTESTKQKWLDSRLKANVDKTELASVERLDAKETDTQLAEIAKGGALVLHLADWLYARTGKPVVLLFNGRGGTPYGYALGAVPHIEIGRGEHLDVAVESELRGIQGQRGATQILAVRDMKISSHEYVHTVEEARHLSGEAPWRTKVRTRYDAVVDGVVEFVPDGVAEILARGWPVIYVDVPTWGPSYSCSTGLDRKQKDRDKWNQGVRRPYKMKSYADHAGYTSYALSAPKLVSPDDIDFVIPEEMIGDDTDTSRICLFVNPYCGEGTPIWDNRPQFLGELGHLYSPLAAPGGYRMTTADGVAELVPSQANVRTDRGTVALDAYVRDRISSLAQAYYVRSLEL